MSSSSAPKYFNQNDINKLAEDPKNKVYTYTHDNPTAIFTIDQQKKHIQDIRNMYLQTRKNSPDLSDIQIRKQIREENKNLDLFAENNGRIFDTCTSRESTPEHINHIKYMLYLREQKENGAIDETTSQQMIQEYLVSKFKTEKTLEQYKAELAKEKAEKKAKQKIIKNN
jgi:hypothetical protein